eukprot:gene6308-biopygen207
MLWWPSPPSPLLIPLGELDYCINPTRLCNPPCFVARLAQPNLTIALYAARGAACVAMVASGPIRALDLLVLPGGGGNTAGLSPVRFINAPLPPPAVPPLSVDQR